MRRFLVVGCGGSGGATLAYMMDQLRSELHSAGVDQLIDGWQFVHIDVPSAAEALLGSARELGVRRVFVLTFAVGFFTGHGFKPIDGTPVSHEVY